ncbi:MAG: chromosomal replication initiator protein DnaA [Malacoplasma sp.]
MNKENFYKESWEIFKKSIKNKFPSEIFYEKYFLDTSFGEMNNNKIKIVVKNLFAKETLEKDYIDLIQEGFSNFINQKCNILFVTKDGNTFENTNPIIKNTSNLNNEMSFNNYIVGDFNKNAYSAVKDILKDASNILWNPIFLYGQTGVGKTHLLNALGIKYKKLYPNKNIKYINTEDFLRNAYSSLYSGGMELEKFKDSYQNIDLLLVDDIQFLTNKEKLNEIFFNIFNYFIKNKKYIIIASDRPSNEINIDKRMISRFESGLSLLIPKPDLETIKLIIIDKIKKIDKRNKLTNNAINFIANRFNDDIRILEGIINKILFFATNDLNPDSILNEDNIRKILSSELSNGLIGSGYKINPNIIIESICVAYSVNPNDVKSKQRQKEITFVRKICIFALREKLSLSYSEIGSFFSNRDHSTIIESYKFIKNLLETDLDLKNFLDNILNKI